MANVKDDLTTAAKVSLATRVSAQKLQVVSVTPDATAVTVGTQVTWTVETSGGTGAKQYFYKLYKGNTVVNTPTWVSEATFTYTPAEAANYALVATARDDGGSATGTSPVTRAVEKRYESTAFSIGD